MDREQEEMGPEFTFEEILNRFCTHYRPEEVHNIVSGKLALKYTGADIEAMKLVANASKNRSLADFQKTVEKYSKELKEDKIVARHLDTLYQTMLEQNLCRIIEPYSRVQVRRQVDFLFLRLFAMMYPFFTFLTQSERVAR